MWKKITALLLVLFLSFSLLPFHASAQDRASFLWEEADEIAESQLENASADDLKDADAIAEAQLDRVPADDLEAADDIIEETEFAESVSEEDLLNLQGLSDEENPDVLATEPDNSDAEEIRDPATSLPQADSLPRKKVSKRTSFLFIGNSMTYVNNMPEMFASLAETGVGEDIYYRSITYSGRTLKRHGYAIRAVIRTGGDKTKLTEAEKAYFTSAYLPGFSSEMYDYYKNAVMYEDGTLKEYDYLILQDLAQSTDYNELKKGAPLIMSYLCSENTRVILNTPFAQLKDPKDLTSFKEKLQIKDANAKRLQEELLSSANCADVEIAYTGRAVSNYLFYAGSKGARRKAPEDYVIYQKKQGGVTNDLIMIDGIHPTQLCSFLFACVLYGAVYHKDAATTIPYYRADVSRSCINLKTLKSGLNYAVQNGPLKEKSTLKMAAFLAYKTQCENWDLTAREDAQPALADAANYRYEYPLETPVIKKITPTANTLTLTWSRVSGASHYLLYTETPYGWVRLARTDDTSYTVKNLKQLTSYTFAVRCVNGAGDEALSRYYSGKLTGKTLLETPKLTKIVNQRRGIRINWTSVKGAVAYRVYRRVPGGSWKRLTEQKKTTYVDTAAKSGKQYIYTVRAVTVDGNLSGFMKPGLKKTRVAQVPLKTVRMKTVKSSVGKKLVQTKAVRLHWGKVKGAVKYRVYRKTGNGSWKLLTTTTQRTVIDYNAKAGHTYTYTVRAVAADNSLGSYNPDGLKITVKK